jgi:hypothetical protein
MHETLKRTVAVAVLAAATAVLPAACARNDSSIFVRGCIAVDRTMCTVTPSLTSTVLLEGTIDAVYAGAYTCFALVENQIVARGNPNDLRTETSGVSMYDAEVQVLDPTQGMASIKNFSVPITGFIDPGTTGMPGLGVSLVLMLDSQTLQALAAKTISSGFQQQVVASVVLHGRTLGGLEEHTNEFLYPITVAAGNSCAAPVGMPCVGGMGSAAMTDCRLGLDSVGGTNCQLIASQLGICGRLECNQTAMGKSDVNSAHCPSHAPPDMSCCNP